MNNKQKKGISLIVLVITIIVMIILASAIIISLSNNGIINKASTAVLKTNLTSMQDMASIYLANNYKDIDMSKEYLITEFGITDKAFEEYIDIAIVKAGKVYIKPTAPENVQEAAKELNMLIDGKASNIGNITLDKTGTALKIYGSAQGVGDKTKNILKVGYLSLFTETNGVYTSTANDTRTTLSMKAQFVVGDTYPTVSVDCPQNNTRYSITITAPTEEWTSFRLANAGKNIESSIIIDLPYEKYKGKDITVSFKVLDNNPASFAISDVMVEEGSTPTEYEPYGYKIPVKMTGKNLFDYETVYSDTTKFTITDGVVMGHNSNFNNNKYKLSKEYIGKQLTFSADLKKAGDVESLYVLVNINGKNIGSNHDVKSNDKFEKSAVTFIPSNKEDFVVITYSNKSRNCICKKHSIRNRKYGNRI